MCHVRFTWTATQMVKGMEYHGIFWNGLKHMEASLWASPPRCSGSREGKGRRTCNYVSGIWIPPPILLWLPIDWAVRFPPISTKRKQARIRNKHWKTCAKGMTLLLMSSLPINTSHRLFRCRYSNSRDVVVSPPSFPAPLPEHPGELAHRLHSSRELHLRITLYGSTPSSSVNHDHTTYNPAGSPILLLFGRTVAWWPLNDVCIMRLRLL